MKLYVKPFAPNALRVTMLADKKDIELEVVTLGADDTKDDDYRTLNPLGQVPALLLDDGEVLTESLVISRYLDGLSGSPFLFGDEPLDQARIAMWERRAEFQLFGPAVEYGHHTHAMFAGRLEQHRAWAESIAPQPKAFLALMSEVLGSRQYVAGERFTVADITAYYGTRMAMVYGLAPDLDFAAAAWLERVEAWQRVA